MVKRLLCIFLTILVLILTTTVLILSTVVKYFGIDKRDVITELEMNFYSELALNESNFSLNFNSDKIIDNRIVARPTKIINGDIKQEDLNKVDESVVGVIKEEESIKQLQKRRAVFQQVKNGNSLEELEREARQRVPKIVHQTWIEATIPERWESIREGCIAMHPD